MPSPLGEGGKTLPMILVTSCAGIERKRKRRESSQENAFLSYHDDPRKNTHDKKRREKVSESGRTTGWGVGLELTSLDSREGASGSRRPVRPQLSVRVSSQSPCHSPFDSPLLLSKPTSWTLIKSRCWLGRKRRGANRPGEAVRLWIARF